MKYISFSLWGNKKIYNVGIIRNSELVKELYTDWKMVVYHDEFTPNDVIENLKNNGVWTIPFWDNLIYGMFWRFFSVDLPNCEYAIFRDADSRVSRRESLAVEEWIESGKTLHVMRDHPFHRIPAGNNQMGILGGMWGIKNGILPLTQMIYEFNKSKEHNYGNDQAFLKMVYNSLENDRFTHDEFFEKKPYPLLRENGRFIGERIDENEKPVTEDYKMLL